MSGSQKRKSMGASPYERILVQRVRSYCEGHGEYDAETCAEGVRAQYREYQRQKMGPFVTQVSRIVADLLSREDDGVCDDLQMVGATMNTSITSMYTAATSQDPSDQGGEQHQQHKEKEDDDDDDCGTRVKKGDGVVVVKKGRVVEKRQTPGGAIQYKRSRSGRSASSQRSDPLPIRYQDLGGIDGVLQDVKELIEYPLKHPEVYSWLGVYPPRGVLLHGPPGCGKTALANAIANECRVPFLRISAPEVVSGMSGESEAKVRGLFQEAAAAAPCIIFIDEIDAIAPKRETAQREMERRIVAQLLTCMDDLSALTMGENEDPPREELANNDAQGHETRVRQHRHVVVIGATNRPDSLDAALRRAGRFDREITMGIPSEASREAILRKMAGKLRLEGSFSFQQVAKRTPGFVGADLAALIKEAAALAVQRIFSQLEEKRGCITEDGKQLSRDDLEGLAISVSDFETAITKVQPSVRREGFATTPDVTWDDVGSLGDVREELLFAISRPIANPHLFEAMGLRVSVGVLLFGPPGCGKTLVAKAVAHDSGANFISIKGPELLNKYVGESERAVRQVFSRARAASPCVLFFDELDALAPRRGSDSSGAAAERVVNQLLTEMDGVDGRQGVYLVAATNRPDMIDPALLRPGRLEKILYVPLPPPEGRASILQALTRSTPLGEDVDLEEISAMPELTGFSGADLASLVREASVQALKERITEPEQWLHSSAADTTMAESGGAVKVMRKHFVMSLSRLQPSVSRKDQRMYDSLRLKLRSSRGHLKPDTSGADDTPSLQPPNNPNGIEDPMVS